MLEETPKVNCEIKKRTNEIRVAYRCQDLMAFCCGGNRKNNPQLVGFTSAADVVEFLSLKCRFIAQANYQPR